MFEAIRKAMFIGIGAADMAAERVQQMVNEMVERGEMTADQGKQLYSDVMSRMEERGRMENERMRTQMRDIMRDMGIPDRTQMAMLEHRMDDMNRKVDQILMHLEEQESDVSIKAKPVT